MISGYYYPANQSARSRADIHIEGSRYTLVHADGEPLHGDISDLDISNRVGNITRRITFPDGTLLETHDNEAIDTWIKSAGQPRNLWLHTLETNLSLIIFSIVFVVTLALSFIKWGIPAISYQVAHALPAELSIAIGEHSIAVLDSTLFTPSSLSEEQQASIRREITSTLLNRVDIDIPIKLHFRTMENSNGPIANAFALPSGDILVTDRMVEQLDQPDELNSVILHEIGHIKHRHGLQHVIRSSTIALLTVFIVGDNLSFGQDLIIAFPTFLTQQGYSRKAEEEADEYALEHMLKLGLDTEAFATALEKIIPDAAKTKNSGNVYLSTHPDTQKRIEAARKY